MRTQHPTFHYTLEIPATARLWFCRKPDWTQALSLLWAAALLLPAFAVRADVVFTNLYSFTGTNDGANPQAALVQGRDGYFYGTTYGGGTNNAGTVFKISSNGVLTSLYSFTGGNDGVNPQTALVQGTDGYFYGTTLVGGNTNMNGNIGYGYGTVFKISTNGAFTTLYSFTGTNDGAEPAAALVQGSDGYFYGTTSYGGITNFNNSNSYGTLFRISANGAFSTLYSFTGGNDGANPLAALVQGSDGYFYGTTSFGGNISLDNGEGFGTVFRISTNGALTTLYSFTGGNDGESPQTALVQGSDGCFYGTSEYVGTVFRISTNGVLNTLYSFTGGNTVGNDASPSGLVQGSDGYFYGTAIGHFFHPFRLVFRISTDGTLTTLYSLTGYDPASPSGLVQGTDGSFYGTSAGGQAGAGVVFRLTIVPESQALTLTNGTLTLTWSTEAGGRYQLQASASLTTPTWTNLGIPVTAINGTISFTDSVTNAPQRFYRVSLAQ